MLYCIYETARQGIHLESLLKGGKQNEVSAQKDIQSRNLDREK